MPHCEEAEFLKFLFDVKPKLALIARHTRGEYNIEDVRNEAWLLLHELRQKRQAVDLACSADRNKLLSYLYQKLVRYTETRIRFASRLEADSSEDDAVAARDRIAERLAAPEEMDPLRVLLAFESARDNPMEPPSHESPASALVVLLRAFDNNMTRLADYLLISVSHSYRCYAKAKRLAIFQRPLRAPISATEEQLIPRPWRRFRIRERRVQDEGKQLKLACLE